MTSSLKWRWLFSSFPYAVEEMLNMHVLDSSTIKKIGMKQHFIFFILLFYFTFEGVRCKTGSERYCVFTFLGG